MLTSWHTVLEIMARTGAIYLLVLLAIRLTGKREVGQMTPFDLTLLLLLSNSVQNAMTVPDDSDSQWQSDRAPFGEGACFDRRIAACSP
jgi:hypothetical protein